MNSPLQVPARHSISVVTPVYNGEASIAELCRRLSEVLPRIATEYEIILVNDGSRDRSWETISELSSRFAAVRGLNLMRNYGQQSRFLKPQMRTFVTRLPGCAVQQNCHLAFSTALSPDICVSFTTFSRRVDRSGAGLTDRALLWVLAP